MISRKNRKGKETIFFGIFWSLVLIYFFNPFLLRGFTFWGFGDRWMHVIPFQLISRRAFQNLQVPQWNPYVFCGKNFMVSVSNVFFYPLNWLVYSFPEKCLPTLLTISLLLHIFFAGLFSFKFFKKYLDDVWWATASSISYLLSIPLVMVWHISVYDYLPFTFFPLWLYLISTAGERRVWQNIVYQTLIGAVILIGGYPQTAMYVVGFCFLYAVLGGSNCARSGRKFMFILPGLIAAGSVGWAIAISAFRLLPYHYIPAEVSRVSYSHLVGNYGIFKSELLRYFVDGLFGRTFGAFIGKFDLFESFSGYAGVIPAFFSVYAMFFIWKGKAIFWKLAVIIIILVLLETPLTYLHYLLTGRAYLMFSRISWLVPICSAVLFGLAAKTIIADRRHLKKAICFFMVAYLFIIGGVGIWYQGLPPEIKMGSGIVPTVKRALIYFTGFFAFMQIVLLSLWRSWIKPVYVKILIAFAILLDLGLIATDIDNHCQAEEMFSPDPIYQDTLLEREVARKFIESGRNIRILYRNHYQENRAVHFGFYESSGYDNFVPLLISRLYTGSMNYDRVAERNTDPPTLRHKQLSSTAYIIDDDLKCLENVPGSLPRVKLFNAYRVLESDEEALEVLSDPQWDIHTSLILSEVPRLPIADGDHPGSAKIINERFNHVAVEVDAPGNSLLLLNDSFAEGWRAFIDGRPSRILRANYAFKAVEIPTGKHRVVFNYTSPGLVPGAVITGFSSLFLLILVGVNFLRKGRKQPLGAKGEGSKRGVRSYE